MSLNALFEEYEVIAETFDVAIPVPSHDPPEIKLTFKSYKNSHEAEAMRKRARDMANACLLAGDPRAETCPMHSPYKDKLPATADEAFQIAQLSESCVGPEPIPFFAMMRLCANRSLFDYLWGLYNMGQRTVYAKLVEANIERAKKKSLSETEDSLSQPSETQAAPTT